MGQEQDKFLEALAKNTYPPDRRASVPTTVALGDTARLLALIYTLGYFSIVGCLIWHVVPLENKDVINNLIGMLTIIQTGIIGYYFGGSKTTELSVSAGVQSRAKADATLQDIARTVPDVLTRNQKG